MYSIVKRRPIPRKRRKSRDHQLTDFASVMLNDHTLYLLIDIEHGLLEELVSCNVLDRRQFDSIVSQANAASRVKQLLEEVGQASYRQQQSALGALHRTHQSHVVKYIVNRGQRPVDDQDGDNWPFCGSEMWIRNVKYCKDLIELIDSRNGLLDEMMAAGCISNQQDETLNNIRDDHSRNRLLVSLMTSMSIADYRKFVECLVETNQQHVAALLEPNAIGGRSEPVSEQHKAHVTQNLPALIDTVDLEHGLLDEMLSAGCITLRQREFIRSAELRAERNKRFLKIVMRGSQENFGHFIECLKKSDQLHIADLLLNPSSVTASMVAKSNLNTQYEDVVVEQFFSLLRTTSSDRREELCSKVTQVTKKLRDIQVFAMQTKSSIKVIFACKSRSGLERLHDLYSRSELKMIVQELFYVLLNERMPVVVGSLTWKMSEYDSCVQYLLPELIYAQLYQLSDCSLANVPTELHERDNASLVEKLPYELFEMLLVKATGQLFVAFVKLTLKAEIYALTTLCAVAKYWHESLTSRMWNSGLLKNYFRRVRHPYTRRPRLQSSIHAEGNFVAGVTELADKLYVISTRSETIQVFDAGANGGSKKLHDIVVKSLLTPVDIVACRNFGHLFISDSFSRCIWRVRTSASDRNAAVDKFLQMPFSPMKLSVRSSRLLVTPSLAGDPIHLYGNDGERMARIPVPNSRRAYHAVETCNETFIVSHGAEGPTDILPDHTTISELSADGEILRTYQGSERLLNYYNFLAVDDSENVMVCDFFNKQVLLLNSKLQLKQLLVSVGECPLKFCLGQRNGLLFVMYGPIRPNSVDAFRVVDRHRTASVDLPTLLNSVALQ